MNKLCRWMCIALLALLLLGWLFGMFDSGVAEKPKLSLGGFLDGSWFSQFGDWYGRNFLGGETMDRAFEKLEDVYRTGEKEK